jgi:hypothetical protein
MSNKEMREKLQGGNIRFTVKDITIYKRGEDGEYGHFPKIFCVSKNVKFIFVAEPYSTQSMNIVNWGYKYVNLYYFNMLGKESTGQIAYSDITFIEQ